MNCCPSTLEPRGQVLGRMHLGGEAGCNYLGMRFQIEQLQGKYSEGAWD